MRQGGEGVLRWLGEESRVEPSGVLVVVMAGGGLEGGVLGSFFCGGDGVEGLEGFFFFLDGDWLCLTYV